MELPHGPAAARAVSAIRATRSNSCRCSASERMSDGPDKTSGSSSTLSPARNHVFVDRNASLRGVEVEVRCIEIVDVEILERDRIAGAAVGGEVDHDIVAVLPCGQVGEPCDAGESGEVDLVQVVLEVLDRVCAVAGGVNEDVLVLGVGIAEVAPEGIVAEAALDAVRPGPAGERVVACAPV